MRTDEETESKNPFKEIVIGALPESITSPILFKNEEILKKIEEDQRNRPNIVFVLERSAVLPASKVCNQISEKYPDIQIIHLPIGKVLPFMFAETKMEIDENFDEADLDLSNSSQAAEFIIWLNNSQDPTIKNLLQQIRTLNLRGMNILVLDDARASGETVELTLPLVIKAIYTRGISFETGTYFSGNFSWEETIIQELGIDLQPSEIKLLSSIMKGSFDIRRFKIELESDFYTIPEQELEQFKKIIEDNYGNGIALIPLDSELTIKMAGYQALFQINSYKQTNEKNNPALGLLHTYGLENLLKITKQIKKKFLEI